MTWKAVDTNADLNELSEGNCWDDSETLEFYANPFVEPYFPSDVSRSGYENMNIHLLIHADSYKGEILEIVFIDADYASLSYLIQPCFNGRVDALKRIYIEDTIGNTMMRCSRLIYRYMPEEPIHHSRRYYATAQQSVSADGRHHD